MWEDPLHGQLLTTSHLQLKKNIIRKDILKPIDLNTVYLQSQVRGKHISKSLCKTLAVSGRRLALNSNMGMLPAAFPG